MHERLIKIFQEVRDIAYRIPLSGEEENRCCSGKAKKLKELLEQEGLQVRYRVCEFRWSDFENIPSSVSSVPHGNDSTHVYLEVLIDGTWVIVDPTWDKELDHYFEIAEWNGRTDTSIAVKPLAVYEVEKSRSIMEEESKEVIEKDLEINGKFYVAFNEWLERVRRDGNKSEV